MTFARSLGLNCVLSCFKRGNVEDMPDGVISTMEAGSRSGNGLGMCPSSHQHRFNYNPVTKPCAAGLVALAIAVALWGFAYRISLYHSDPAPQIRASVAKLWVERRCGEIVSSFVRTTKPPRANNSNALLFSALSPIRLRAESPSACPCDARPCATAVRLLPSRAPPAQSIFSA